MGDSCETHLALALATAPRPSRRRRRRRQPCSSSSKSLALSLTTGGASTVWQEGAADQLAAAREGDEEEEISDVRKKIRVTKEQSAMLEIRFRLQSNLTSKQKQALAKQLNLQPRQVEVWFQNRRARKKLKQTEIDCEFLKRCYEALSKENQLLQKELQEMKVLELAARQPPADAAISTLLPVAGLSVCPTCGKISGGDAAAHINF